MKQVLPFMMMLAFPATGLFGQTSILVDFGKAEIPSSPESDPNGYFWNNFPAEAGAPGNFLGWENISEADRTNQPWADSLEYFNNYVSLPYVALSDMVDQNGDSTGVSMAMTSYEDRFTYDPPSTSGGLGWAGHEYADFLGPVPTSTGYPGSATIDSFYINFDKVATFTLSGLDDAKTYTIICWTGVSNGARLAKWTVNSLEPGVIEAFNNTGANAEDYATFNDVSPVNGEIIIAFEQGIEPDNFLPNGHWSTLEIIGEFGGGDNVPSADIHQGTATVDGVIESAWNAYPMNTLEVDIDGTSPAADDLSGYWKAMWDESNLYFLLVTNDDVLVPFPGGPQEWRYDTTEIFLDPDGSRGSSYDGVDDTQIGFLRGGELVKLRSNPLNLVFDGSTHAIVAGEGMVIIETAIAWSDLGISPSVGVGMGLDVYMKDTDDGVSRNNQISWSPSGDQAWQNPSLFGMVTLAEAPDNLWNGYPVDGNGWVDTNDWIGWVNVTYDPWIWSTSLDKYIYIGDGSGWVYVPR
jgi:hypothetical protein